MANERGWQIGIVRADADPENRAEDEWTTESEERAAMQHAGIEPEEMIDSGMWIAAIPEEWARQAENADGSECEPGVQIQECIPHEITGPDGRKWTIEIPMP